MALTLKNAADDVVSFLDGQVVGTLTLAMGSTLFIGRLRDLERGLTPTFAVSVLNTGGPSPMPYLGGTRRSWYRPTVQVLVRAPPEDLETGESVSRAVFGLLHQADFTALGYVAVFARDAQPVLLGADSDGRLSWTINVELQYTAEDVSN